jgi:hypothetical protein
MKRTIVTSIILLAAVVNAQAHNYIWEDTRKPARPNGDAAVTRDAASCDAQVGARTRAPSAKYRKCMASHGWRLNHIHWDKPAPRSRSASEVTVWDRDSPNPNVGWHWRNGMRVCTQDCDNPEIPGSGAVCRNVNVMGMRMHECVRSN